MRAIFGANAVHLRRLRDVVVTVRHAESPDLAQVRRRLEQTPKLLCLGPEAVFYAILDQVVDEYGPVVAGLENDIDEIEDQLFKGDPAVSRRIYELSREVIEFQRATRPLLDMLTDGGSYLVSVKVDTVWDPPWHPSMMSEIGRAAAETH
jgi:Mg2+ and Co2+ transporter CorA